MSLVNIRPWPCIYVSANKNQNLLKNLNLLCNPSVFREGGYCVIEEFKGTSAGSVCAMPRNVECMNAGVGVGDQLWLASGPDTLAPEEAPGTGLPVDACALRSTTAFRDWLL